MNDRHGRGDYQNVGVRETRNKDSGIAGRDHHHLVRELRDQFEPSNPLMAGGANVEPLLIPQWPERRADYGLRAQE